MKLYLNETIEIQEENSKMKKKLLTVLLVVSILTLLPVISVQAKKPLGTMDLTYNQAWLKPQPLIPDWVGTITFDIDNDGIGEEYGMLFFAIGSGKEFDDFLKGKVHFFEEIWVIYDLQSKVFPPLPEGNAEKWSYWLPDNNPAELVLWGYDKGQTNIQNSKYRMNGNIEEAFGAFSMWMGHNVHMSGIIEWLGPGVPDKAPGIFRIN